ncbi:hypothetical protein AAG570_007769 [Ranatra chinensis]|uniref:Sidoreflexin n=1 Tax=Ranatra chinensis TaxID=642074 RepID=A0ABD0XUG8_9HEMI
MEPEEGTFLPKVDINVARWDQSTYIGRAKYYFSTTNPFNLFIPSSDLEKAKILLDKYKLGKPLTGVTIDDIYKAKEQVDSAFHPDTGEKMILIGRMSAQVPMNMLITGCMMTFYRSTSAVIFWQWINQSFNAIVNYTNRSGTSPIPNEQLGKSYIMATGGAVFTALSLNKVLHNAPSIIGRLVPFIAVAAANCINIPLMRIKELKEGVPVYDENNQLVGKSKIAACKGITAVVFSRVVMCAPGMVLTPIIVNWLDKRGLFKRYPKVNLPIQLGVCGICLAFATPMCCALFPQKSAISVINIEPELQVHCFNFF